MSNFKELFLEERTSEVFSGCVNTIDIDLDKIESEYPERFI